MQQLSIYLPEVPYLENSFNKSNKKSKREKKAVINDPPITLPICFDI